MFSVIEKTMTSQSKKRFESCYETSIDCIIYSILLFQTETLNSYRLCKKVFASDWESQLVYSQSIILRSMINWNESIKTLNANLESTAITCRTTESNEYLWWNSVTISISSRSLLDWLSSQVSSWHFELKLRSSRVTHIFNSIRVELLIFSTWRNSTRLEIEST